MDYRSVKWNLLATESWCPVRPCLSFGVMGVNANPLLQGVGLALGMRSGNRICSRQRGWTGFLSLSGADSGALRYS